MTIVDLVLPQNYAKFKDDFEYFVDTEIKNGDFKLKENYLNLNVSDYVSFTCLLNEASQIVGFSALQQGPFPHGTLRVLNKLFYGGQVRQKGFRPFPSLATQYMLPYQLEVARKTGAEFVFVSFQSDLKRDHFVKAYEDALNQSTPEGEWKLMAGLYNTCPPCGEGINDHPACWQRIICLDLKDSKKSFNLPKRSYE